MADVIDFIDTQTWTVIDSFSLSNSNMSGLTTDGLGWYMGGGGTRMTPFHMDGAQYSNGVIGMGGVNNGVGEMHFDGQAVYIHGQNSSGNPSIATGRTTLINLSNGKAKDTDINPGFYTVSTGPNTSGGFDGQSLWGELITAQVGPFANRWRQVDTQTELRQAQKNIYPTNYEGGTFDGMYFYVCEGTVVSKIDQSDRTMDSNDFGVTYRALEWDGEHLVALRN